MSLEGGRRHVVERFVDSPVVEPVHVVQCRPFDVLDVAPGSFAVNQFVLVETVERFGERVDAPICQELIKKLPSAQTWLENQPSLDHRVREQ